MNKLSKFVYDQNNPVNINRYFTSLGFHDLLPIAEMLAKKQNYSRLEMADAICKVADKANIYPPTLNRTGWFIKVYSEKLAEARAERLASIKGNNGIRRTDRQTNNSFIMRF